MFHRFSIKKKKKNAGANGHDNDSVYKDSTGEDRESMIQERNRLKQENEELKKKQEQMETRLGDLEEQMGQLNRIRKGKMPAGVNPFEQHPVQPQNPGFLANQAQQPSEDNFLTDTIASLDRLIGPKGPATTSRRTPGLQPDAYMTVASPPPPAISSHSIPVDKYWYLHIGPPHDPRTGMPPPPAGPSHNVPTVAGPSSMSWPPANVFPDGSCSGFAQQPGQYQPGVHKPQIYQEVVCSGALPKPSLKDDSTLHLNSPPTPSGGADMPRTPTLGPEVPVVIAEGVVYPNLPVISDDDEDMRVVSGDCMDLS